MFWESISADKEESMKGVSDMSQDIERLDSEKITDKIYTIRGLQVMIDSELAELYGVETKNLNRAVNRNIERFPENFRFQLSDEEYKNLRFQNGTSSEDKFLRSQFVTLKKEKLTSQTVISNNSDFLRFQNGTLKNDESVSQTVTPEDNRGKHRKYLPYVFTEQGVSMLSAVLNSPTAIEMSIKIINTFVNMRRFLSENGQIFQRLDLIEKRQIAFESKADDKFNALFNALEDKSIKATQGIFFDGQVFDAYVFIADLIKTAKESIILIDNFIDETVLLLLSKRNDNCKVTIYTKAISEQLKLDLKKYNAQYPRIEIKIFNDAHDRFMILDEKEIYLIGASLKDLGKKWFAFSKLEADTLDILRRLGNGK